MAEFHDDIRKKCGGLQLWHNAEIESRVRVWGEGDNLRFAGLGSFTGQSANKSITAMRMQFYAVEIAR